MLTLTLAALLAAEPPALPPNHPQVPPAAAQQQQAQPQPGVPEGHPPLSGKAPPTAEELLKQLDATPGLKDQPKTFDIASSLGKLYYLHGRPRDAVPYFQQAEAKGEPVRALYLAQKKKLGAKPVPSATEARCGFGPDTGFEQMAETAQERAKKGDAPGAAACARAALAPVLQTTVMRGNALMLTGDTAGALKTYAEVLAVEPTHDEALYSHAALLWESKGDDPGALRQAREELERYAKAHPNTPRAQYAQRLLKRVGEVEQAGGRSKWAVKDAAARKEKIAQLPQVAAATPRGPMQGGPMQGGPMQGGAPMGGPVAPQVSAETMQAMQNVERTPEMEANLDKLLAEGEEHLARGNYDAALSAYRQVMPLRPDGRTQAGLAWALNGLGKPTFARVWSVATQNNPDAVDKLGDTLKAKGDVKGAQALWTKLAESAPEYASRSGLQAKLK